MQLMVDYLLQSTDSSVLLGNLMDAIASKIEDTTQVTAALVTAILEAQASPSDADEVQVVQVISAADFPQVQFDPIRKRFSQLPPNTQRHATAEAKTAIYTARFNLLHQRLRRNPLFCPPALKSAGAARPDTPVLTDLKSIPATSTAPCYVTGCITQLEDGRFSLVAGSEARPLDLSASEITPGCFTENCVVLIEGVGAGDGSLEAKAMGFPPLETRHDTHAAVQGLNMFGGTPVPPAALEQQLALEAGDTASRLLVLSDVWLDSPTVLDALHLLFNNFGTQDIVPPVIVFMGNFDSCEGAAAGAVDFTAHQQHWAALGALIRQYPRIAEESTFIFIPGPGDAGAGNILPRAPLPSFLTSPLREALPSSQLHFPSSPCRLRYRTQEIVLHRANLQHSMLRRALRPPAIAPPGPDAAPGDNHIANALFTHLAHTLLHQSHLSPVPLQQQPVYWAQDYALQLYPLPDALILGDAAPQAQCVVEVGADGCACFNPGPITEGQFAAYVPGTRATELSLLPSDGMQE